MGAGSEIKETFNALRQHRRQQKALRATRSLEVLARKKISCLAGPGSGHYRVFHNSLEVDFWPTTGTWMCSSGVRGWGLADLLTHLGFPKPTQRRHDGKRM